MGEWAESPALAAMVAESTLVVLSAGVLAIRHRTVAATDTARAPVATMVERPA